MDTQRNNPEIKHRVITMLGREEMEFLDKLGKDALFSTGHKLSYNDILRGLIDFAIEIKLSGQKVDSAQAFQDKLREIIRFHIQELKKENNNDK